MKKFAVLLAGLEENLSWPLNEYKATEVKHNANAINRTLQRHKTLFSNEECFVLLSKENKDAVMDKIITTFPNDNYICEPFLRGTATGIFYAALKLDKKYGESVMAVLPTDHYIDEEEKYQKVLSDAMDVAKESDKIVTIGLKPSYSAGNYGYINFKKNFTFQTQHIFQVIEFIEKPGETAAQHYLTSEEYVWNSGIYVFKTSTIINACKQFLPLIYSLFMQEYDVIGTDLEEESIEKIYPQIKHLSIDYGVMERSDNVVLLLGDFGWSDIGTVSAVLGEIKGKVLSVDCDNMTVLGNERLIITIGCENIFVADTQDVLLICHKDGLGKINNLKEFVKQNGFEV